MKKIIKKYVAVLFAVFLTAGFSMNALAQSDDATIKAKADVLTEISVSVMGNLVFGNVSPGINKSVSPTGTVTPGRTGDERAGEFQINKVQGSYVTIEFTGLLNPLNHVGEPAVEAQLQITHSETDAHICTDGEYGGYGFGCYDFDPDGEYNLINLEGSSKTNYFNATSFHVWIGGTVQPAPDQAAGPYEGDITLTATYN